MNFTSGQMAFIVFFLVSFIALISWSYWKERKLISTHYKGAYKMFIIIMVVLIGLRLIIEFFG